MYSVCRFLIRFASISPISCLLTFLIMSLEAEKIFKKILVKSNLSNFSIVACTFY